MSKLRWFVESAASVAAVQESILNAMESVFPENDYPQLEATILAPGYEGWESRAISLIKMGVNEHWGQLKHHVETINARYKAAVPYPGQTAEYWVDPLTAPHLRVYWCLKCGHQQTSLALSGICCHGQPKCLRCFHQVHEENCRRKPAAQAPVQPPEQEPT